MITIDYGNTFVITIPKTYSTLFQSSPFEVRQLDINQFRLDLKVLEASEEGIVFPDTHDHNTERILSGVSYARLFEILSPYTIEFEDGQYGVTLEGGNNNLLDVKVANQVSLLANNSGGLIGSEAINSLSFLGGFVYINELSPNSGIIFPTGSVAKKVNNFIDAKAIADTRGFESYNLENSLTLISSYDTSNTLWVGTSPIRASLTLDQNDTFGCEFQNLAITGTANGFFAIRDCRITNLSGFWGTARDCLLQGNITIDSSSMGPNILAGCTSGIPGTATPILDINSAISDIQIRNYTGGLEIRNFNQGNNMSADFHSGKLTIDSSCTSGTIVVRGVVELVDNSGPGCTVITTGTITELASVNVGNIDSDWTDTEKKQIRDALGVDGDKSVAKGGQLQEKSEYPFNSTINTNEINN